MPTELTDWQNDINHGTGESQLQANLASGDITASDLRQNRQWNGALFINIPDFTIALWKDGL